MTDLIPAWVDGHLTPVEKIDAHRRGLRHMAVSVFLLDGPRVLIQRRAMAKYHTPGLWANTCCTHPHWDEAAGDCARRRLHEELGIGGVALIPAGQVEYRADVGGGLTEHEVVQIFRAEVSGDLPVRPNPAEVMETRWIELDDLLADIADRPEKFTPWLRIYLRDHRAQIFAGHSAIS
ncbi:MAG: isopentenyl-diphosphate Delta-isomerase [Rhodobacteraceae bacterium]|nr:isopentenyl-diphosphate Delta-isomerase [Paracoccaceae bacterium]